MFNTDLVFSNLGNFVILDGSKKHSSIDVHIFVDNKCVSSKLFVLNSVRSMKKLQNYLLPYMSSGFLMFGTNDDGSLVPLGSSF